MDFQLVYPKKVPFLNGIDYVPWSIRIEAYMQVFELDIWSVVDNGYTNPKNQPKGSITNNLHKKNPKKMNAILNGLSYCEKNKMGQWN